MTHTATPAGAPPLIKDWQALLILAVLVALFFREILLERAFFWEDFLKQAYPFRTFAAVSLAGGELPLWNPYTFGGMPFLADIQSGILYLPNLLLTAFVRDGRLSFYAFEVSLIIHYWIAGVTMYFLAKEFELQPVYALFSGLVFALSGFLIVQAIHPAFIQQLAWFPLALLLLHRALLRKSITHAILAGLTVGLSLLAGAPQMTLFLILLLASYSLFTFAASARESGVRSNLHMMWLPAVAVVVALGVAAVQLLPTIELRPLSERATMTFAEAQNGRLEWQQLLTAVIPKFFGYVGAQARLYWGPGQYGAFWESCFYIDIAGLLAAAKSVALLRSNRTVLFLFALGVFAFLVALGDQFVLHRLLFNYLPSFGAFRGVGRIMVLATFAGALLAGFGLRSFIDSAAANPRRMEWSIAAAAGLVFVLWLVMRLQVIPALLARGGQSNILADAMGETTKALVLTLTVSAICVLVTRRVIRPKFALPALLLTQYADMNLFGFDQNNSSMSSEDYFDEISPDVIRILREEGKKEIFRVVSRRDTIMFLDRNHGQVERIFLLEGYTPLQLRRYLPPARDLETTYDLMNVKYRPREIDLAGTVALRSSPNYYPRAFVVHDAVVVPGGNDDEIDAHLGRFDFDPRRTVVLDHDPGLSLDGSGATTAVATIISYGVNRISLDVLTPKNGILVLSEVFYPGWRARVNDVNTPLLRADGYLRGVALPPGSHRVEITFEPRSYYNGLTISLATLFVAFAMIIITSRHAVRAGKPHRES